MFNNSIKLGIDTDTLNTQKQTETRVPFYMDSLIKCQRFGKLDRSTDSFVTKFFFQIRVLLVLISKHHRFVKADLYRVH